MIIREITFKQGADEAAAFWLDKFDEMQKVLAVEKKDDKTSIVVGFADELDFLAFLCATGQAVMQNVLVEA